jgi:serine/threonine-protein kinase
MAGRVLGGRYTVQDKIGAGGMATVYRGVDEVLGRTVAIKTMLPQYANDESFAARFKQEAQAAAALQSPYIVSVYDWGRDGDTYYIVMEYLRGIDLKSGIRRHGALDPQKVAQIGLQISQALSAAHKHDIIHRDIKPQNIMVQQDGNIKVMDFGIARAKNSHLTQDNSVLGTAHYVSPEQTQGRELGPTTDIYSLGVVMYEASTGQVPFDGDDAITVALKQVNEQPLPPSQRNPAVDPSLEGIILKCMQKNPLDRFQTADELARVLRDYLAGRIQAVNAATAGITATQVNPASIQTLDGSSGALPTVDRTSDGRTHRKKPTTATERARLEAKREQRRHRRRTVLVVLAMLAALALAGFVAWQIYQSANALQEVPNLLNQTQDVALEQIDRSDFFARGTVTPEYSTTVEEGLVMDQEPDPYRKVERDTPINLWVSKGPEPAKAVTVPDIKGKTPAEAEAMLAEVNLVGQVGDSVFDASVEINSVSRQSPAANTTAREGDTVIYQLSKGIESVEVPNVVGYDEYTATNMLTEKRFEVSTEYDYSSYVEAGYVIQQSETGTADKGSTITIVVSMGPQQVEVPDVIGYSQDYAESLLTEAGFGVSVTTEENSYVDAGYVVSQSTSGSADAGSTIGIVVSSGPAQSTQDESQATQGDQGEQGEQTEQTAQDTSSGNGSTGN